MHTHMPVRVEEGRRKREQESLADSMLNAEPGVGPDPMTLGS